MRFLHGRRYRSLGILLPGGCVRAARSHNCVIARLWRQEGPDDWTRNTDIRVWCETESRCEIEELGGTNADPITGARGIKLY